MKHTPAHLSPFFQMRFTLFSLLIILTVLILPIFKGRASSPAEDFRLTVYRQFVGSQCTSGYLAVNGVITSYTLERPWRDNQQNISSIPAGSYNGLLRYDHTDHWRIELLNVPGRTNVQIHVGNEPDQTKGCILVGSGLGPDLCSLKDSKSAYNALKAAFYGTENPTATPNKNIIVEIVDQGIAMHTSPGIANSELEARLVRADSVMTNALTAIPQQTPTPDVPPQLQQEFNRRLEHLTSFFSQPAQRGEVTKIVKVSMLAEDVIRTEAQRMNITASDAEVTNFLIPLLSRQGLVDITKPVDPRTDPNVRMWLVGQKWTVEQLYDTARTMLLWVKMAVKDTTVNKAEVKAYLDKNPYLRYVPNRVLLTLSQFDIPANSAGMSRGVAQADLLAPTLSPTARSGVEAVRTHQSAEWQDLKLYLDLNQLDPVLRQALQGKTTGANFGPVQLHNGSIIAGKVTAILPAMDFATINENPLLEYASIMARLEKSNQQGTFDQLLKQYLNNLPAGDPRRGFFGDLGGLIGAGIGGLFGGIGAPIGGLIGGIGGNWLDSQMSAPGPQQPPPYATMNPGFAPPTGIPQMPPAWTGGFPSPPPLQFVPPPPPSYQTMYNAWANAFPPIPQVPIWAPPFWMPMPVRF